MNAPEGAVEHPYDPNAGAPVVDTATGRLGRVLGPVQGVLWIRPIGGGDKWEADPNSLRPATAREVSEAWAMRGRA